MIKYLLFICLLISSHLNATEIYGKVVGVTDGDTIKVLDADNTLHKIRMYGIDAPEKKQPFGQKAKGHLSSIVFSKNVRVNIINADRYGRSVGIVYLKDGFTRNSVNLDMIIEGYAWAYLQYIKALEDRILYAECQDKAKNLKLGLWVDKNPTAPWEYRKSKKRK